MRRAGVAALVFPRRPHCGVLRKRAAREARGAGEAAPESRAQDPLRELQAQAAPTPEVEWRSARRPGTLSGKA